jgi:hypothetical protein
MQYLIVETLEDNTKLVHLGPMNWRPTFFQNVITDELEIDFTVPLSNDSEQKVVVSSTVVILPCKEIGIIGDINPKIQFAQGPFYNYYEDHAELYYTPEDKQVNSVQGELKTIVAANRYAYEIFGVKVTIQGKEVIALTTRGDRDLYLQAYQMGKNDVNWKFGTEFLVLSNDDLGIIVLAVTNHVQNVFDWEAGKVAEIDAATTLAELDAIVLKSDNPDWNPPAPPNPFEMV